MHALVPEHAWLLLPSTCDYTFIKIGLKGVTQYEDGWVVMGL